MGSRVALTATIEKNLAMRAIFERQGFTVLSNIAIYPTGEHIRDVKAVLDSRTLNSGEDFLDVLGITDTLKAEAGSLLDAFRPCISVQEVQSTLESLVKEDPSQELASLGLIPAEYRVFSYSQVHSGPNLAHP